MPVDRSENIASTRATASSPAGCDKPFHRDPSDLDRRLGACSKSGHPSSQMLVYAIRDLSSSPDHPLGEFGGSTPSTVPDERCLVL